MRMKWYAFALALLLSGSAGLAAAQTDNLLSGDTDLELESESMTSGAFSNSFPQAPRWTLDTVAGYQSSNSIRLTREITGMGVKHLQLPAGKYTFSFYAKADKPGATGYIAVNRITNSWPEALKNREAGAIPLTTDWKRYSTVFESDGQSLYSGYYGCLEAGVCFDRFMINRGETPLPWVATSKQVLILQLPAGSGNVYRHGQKLSAEMKLVCYTKDRPAGKIRVSLRDFTGKQQMRREFTPKFDADGICTQKIELPTDSSGWFILEAEQPDSGAKAANQLVIARPPEQLPPQAEPFVGLCGAENQLEAAKILGIRWLQKYISWYEVSDREEQLNFETYSKLRDYKKQGFRIQALVTTGPPNWALPPEMRKDIEKLKVNYARCVAPEDMQEKYYRPFIRKFMEQYNGVIDIYELGGELDALLGLNVYYKGRDNKNMTGPFVLGESFDLAAGMMEIAAQEIRRADPKARISSVRPSDVDARYGYIYSREFFKRLGKYMTCFGIDCYPQPRWIGPGQPPTGTEQDLAIRLRDARAAMKGLVNSQDVMISEYGYFIDYTKVTDPKYISEQVNRLARSFLYARLIGMKSLHYFTTRSSGLEGQRYFMGLWYQGRPLAAAAALSAVGQVVENVSECREIRHNRKMGVGVFRKTDGRAAAAIWSIDDSYAPQVEIPFDKFTVADVMGNPVAVQPQNGKILLTPGPLPVYIWRTVRGEDNYTVLGDALDKLRIREPVPVQLAFRMKNADTLKAYLSNASQKHAVRGYAEYEIDGKRGKTAPFTIPAESSGIVELPLPASGKTIRMVFHFEGDYLPFSTSWTAPELIQVKRIEPAELSAGLKIWKDVSPVRISGKSHIHPVDHTTYEGADDLSADLYLAHDGDNLYFAADVTDDRHFNRFERARLWRGDCIQLGFDPDMNFLRNVNDLDPDDTTLSCGLLKTGPAADVHRGPHRFELQKKLQYQVIRDEISRHTLYLLKMPLKALGDLKKDSIFGFNCVVMDDDTDSGADYWLFLRQGLAGGLRPDKFAPCILK